MKTLKVLVMAALTIFSVSVFAQDTAKTKIKSAKQKIEKLKEHRYFVEVSEL